jgi:signal transduction protein with GAF and PtsI domain
MRLGRTAWFILGIGVFVIAFATLFTIYFRQSAEAKELENSLAGAQTQLAQLISGRESLEAQLTLRQSELNGAQASLSSARASFPKLEASIEYDEVLSDLADDYNLEVLSMEAEKPLEKEVEGITFLVVSFEVEVRGEVNSILDMVSAIAEDDRLDSATVEVVDIKVPQVTCAGEEPDEPTATIKLVGYSYGGD